MRIPQSPPSLNSLFTDPENLRKAFSEAGQEIAKRANANYLHWDKFRHYPLPEGFTHELAWAGIRISRNGSRADLPISFKGLDEYLTYSTPACVARLLHQLDRDAGGFIGSNSDRFLSEEDRDRYLVNSLIEEAIASSQLEGATTTRDVAKKMLRSKRKPKDKSERMIANNYAAIQEIVELKSSPLTIELIKHLQEVITAETLDNPKHSGTFREEGDEVCVVDAQGEVVHKPPHSRQIKRRLDELCDFVNDEQRNDFVHPLIAASAIHFAIGYIHPFADGNGRTARALFYWYMLKQNYWLFEYLPISRAILDSPIKYARAFLYTETDEGDLTYFIHYSLRVVEIAIRRTHDYIQRHQVMLRRAKQMFRSLSLNPRQFHVASEAVNDSSKCFDVRSHMAEHDVVRTTARTDLEGLVAEGILTRVLQGNKHVYFPSDHLKKYIRKGRLAPGRPIQKQLEAAAEIDEPVAAAATASLSTEATASDRRPSKGQKSLFDPAPPDEQ